MREMRQMIFSPYLAEVPMPISMGTHNEIMESQRYGEEFKEKYEDGRVLKIGTRYVMVHGDIYNDIINQPLFIRLSWIKQLGMHGFISSIAGTDDVVDISAGQTRYAHSIDVGVRMEIASRLNGLDEEAVKLGTSSGLLHDAYTPPMSEQGKRANTEALDEEKNIELILNNKGLVKALEKRGVKPYDLISVVRGEYPALGSMLNSKGLDIDKISYTVIDSSNIHPYSAAKDTELFEFYNLDPYVQDLHESLFIDENENVSFLRAEHVRRLLYLRAWMFKNVYFAPKNRAREAFFEREVKKLWDEDKLSLEKMLNMNDYDFERFIKNNVKKKFHSEFLRMFPDAFHEVTRIKDADVENIKKEYGNRFLVVKQPKFNPGTDTLVSGVSRKSVPFREVFPEDAKKIEDMADSCEYIGVYRADL